MNRLIDAINLLFLSQIYGHPFLIVHETSSRHYACLGNNKDGFERDYVKHEKYGEGIIIRNNDKILR
jgi:hypothetical protein